MSLDWNRGKKSLKKHEENAFTLFLQRFVSAEAVSKFINPGGPGSVCAKRGKALICDRSAEDQNRCACNDNTEVN